MSGADPFKGLDPDAGEQVIAEFRADRRAYWRSHLIMAALGGVIAGTVLVILGDANPWVGPVAAIAALVLRGAYLQSEMLRFSWVLTDRRLILPGPQAVRLTNIDKVRPLLGDVQIITKDGHKHLIRYPASAARVVQRISDAMAKTRA